MMVFVNLGYRHYLFIGDFGIDVTFVEDAGDEVFDFITQAFANIWIEEFAVQLLVFVSDLKVICSPPRSRDIDVALCSGDDEVAFGFHTKTYLE